MALLIKKEGIFTSLQHCGRFGLQKFGINPSGAMDRTAARLLNVLLGNDECDAVLEMHFPAAEIVFEEGTVFAIGGADFQPTLDGKDITPWLSNHAESSSRLKFTKNHSGQRCYLAIAGGMKTESGPIFATQRLMAGTQIATAHDPARTFVGQRIATSLIPKYSASQLSE